MAQPGAGRIESRHLALSFSDTGVEFRSVGGERGHGAEAVDALLTLMGVCEMARCKQTLRSLVVFSVLWAALVGGQIAESWYLGLPAVALAAAIRLRLSAAPHARLHPAGLARFVPLFLWRSLIGGVDVAARALRPSLPVDPGLIEYRLRLEPDSAPAWFFVEVISLLPGTLCTRQLADGLEVHVIDRSRPVAEELARVEAAIAALFGASIDRHSPAAEAP